MSAVATKFSNVTMKFQIGAAAVAVAAAATLTPAVVADAQPVGQLAPISQALGNSIVLEPHVAHARTYDSAHSSPITPLFQNSFWWFGTPNPNPPAGGEVFTFTPLSLIPGFLRPLYSWFTQNINFEACILGASLKFGPYGSVTGSLSGGGC